MIAVPPSPHYVAAPPFVLFTQDKNPTAGSIKVFDTLMDAMRAFWISKRADPPIRTIFDSVGYPIWSAQAGRTIGGTAEAYSAFTLYCEEQGQVDIIPDVWATEAAMRPTWGR